MFYSKAFQYLCYKNVFLDENPKTRLTDIKKSRIRETKHLSTYVDSSTNAIGGWTKNTPKPIFFENRKKSSKAQKLKIV